MITLAHAGGHGMVPPGDPMSHWSIDPGTLALLAGVAGLYALCLVRIRRAGAGGALGPRHVGAFCAGLGLLAVALLGPLEAFSGTLLSVHMAQHMALVALAAPLLAYGAPPVRMAVALPTGTRRSVERHRRALRAGSFSLATAALVAVAFHSLTVWAWHVPVVYEAAVAAPVLHGAEHLTFLATAVLVWWAVFAFGGATRPSLGVGAALVALGVQGAALGALMTFSGSAWYGRYSEGAALHGLDPLADQQVAGLLMWGLGGLGPVLVGGVLTVLWLERLERFPRTSRPRSSVATGGPGKP